MNELEKFPAVAPAVSPHEQQLAKEVWEALGCRDHFTRQFIAACFVAIRVFDYKQRHYGPGNIARSGARGVATRLGDKLARIDNMLASGKKDAKEPIEDSFGDVGNYGLIGLMCRWGWWPGVQAGK